MKKQAKTIYTTEKPSPNNRQNNETNKPKANNRKAKRTRMERLAKRWKTKETKLKPR